MLSTPYCSMPALTDCGIAAMCTGQPCWSWATRRPWRSNTPVERSLPSLKITECAVLSMVIVTSSQTWMKPFRITSRVTASMPSRALRCSTVAMSGHLLGELALAGRLPLGIGCDDQVALPVYVRGHVGRDPQGRALLLEDHRTLQRRAGREVVAAE